MSQRPGAYDPFSLKALLGNGLDNHPRDVSLARRALNNLGYDAGDEDDIFINPPLTTAILQFQDDHNLKRDGWMRPRGETEHVLNFQLAENTKIKNGAAEKQRAKAPILPGVSDEEVFDFLKNEEGSPNHLYLDTRGNPTIGIGTLVPNLKSFIDLPLQLYEDEKSLRPATREEKVKVFEEVKRLPKGQIAQKYKSENQGYRYPDLQLSDRDIKNLAEIKAREAVEKLARDIKNFQDLPPNVKKALLDMGYNLGPGGFTPGKWKELFGALEQKDFERAAKESHRKGVGEDRNKHIHDLLKNSGE